MIHNHERGPDEITQGDLLLAGFLQPSGGETRYDMLRDVLVLTAEAANRLISIEACSGSLSR